MAAVLFQTQIYKEPNFMPLQTYILGGRPCFRACPWNLHVGVQTLPEQPRTLLRDAFNLLAARLDLRRRLVGGARAAA
eukprot:10802656-Lingulodinium_polyedra.AAC.1